MHPKSAFRAPAIAGVLFVAIALLPATMTLAQESPSQTQLPPGVPQVPGQNITAQPNSDGSFTVHIEPAKSAPPSVSSLMQSQQKSAGMPMPASSAQSSCPPPPGTPSHAIFQGLKGVNFYLSIPTRFRLALQCHGHEMECAQQYSDHDRYAQQLKDDYDAYPQLLRPEHLTQLFVKQIEQKVSPFLHRDEQCNLPPVQVLDHENLFRSVNLAGTLTVTVTLVVDGEGHPPTQPHFGVLSMHLFRPDCGHANYDVDVMGSGVMTGAAIIPLDLPESDLSKRLDYILAHSQVSTILTTDAFEGIRKQ